MLELVGITLVTGATIFALVGMSLGLPLLIWVVCTQIEKDPTQVVWDVLWTKDLRFTTIYVGLSLLWILLLGVLSLSRI